MTTYDARSVAAIDRLCKKYSCDAGDMKAVLRRLRHAGFTSDEERKDIDGASHTRVSYGQRLALAAGGETLERAVREYLTTERRPAA